MFSFCEFTKDILCSKKLVWNVRIKDFWYIKILDFYAFFMLCAFQKINKKENARWKWVTVGKNIIGAPKMQNDYSLIYYSLIQSCDINSGLFFIGPCKVSALYLHFGYIFLLLSSISLSIKIDLPTFLVLKVDSDKFFFTFHYCF